MTFHLANILTGERLGPFEDAELLTVNPPGDRALWDVIPDKPTQIWGKPMNPQSKLYPELNHDIVFVSDDGRRPDTSQPNLYCRVDPTPPPPRRKRTMTDALHIRRIYLKCDACGYCDPNNIDPTDRGLYRHTLPKMRREHANRGGL